MEVEESVLQEYELGSLLISTKDGTPRKIRNVDITVQIVVAEEGGSRYWAPRAVFWAAPPAMSFAFLDWSSS